MTDNQQQGKPQAQVREEGRRIYIASKTKHADRWRELREEGANIISTWIDEAGVGESADMPDLCRRCIKEAAECDAMIVYSEDGDYLKGAFIEMGVALSVPGKDIYLVGPVLPYGSAFTYSQQVFLAKSVNEAIQLINASPLPSSIPTEVQKEENKSVDELAKEMYPDVENDLYKPEDIDYQEMMWIIAQNREAFKAGFFANSRGMWVNADERLPEMNGDIIFRITGTTNQVGCSFKEYTGFMLPGPVFRKDYENIEWLDEAGFLAASPKGKDTSGMQWQLCPKCNGDGNLARYNSPSIIGTDAALLCDVCNGAKILATPSAPLLSTQQGERRFTLKEALEIYYDAQLFEYADNSRLYFKHKFGINL